MINHSSIQEPNAVCNSRNERGAALVTVLLLSMLLLAVGGTLILVSGMATRTAVDATAEMQAYYSAEAGLQATINVLRGNVEPNASMPAGSKINFRNAITLSSSNLPTDGSGTPRLSGWLNYDYVPQGQTRPDRVSLTANYAQNTGMAFSVTLTDPDNIPVADGEPVRLRLRSVGYGPKGAVKQMELIIKRSNFDYDPVATILMRSSDDGTPVNFVIGDSAAKDYSGHDNSGSAILPTFGATTAVDTAIEIIQATKGTVATPIAATIPIGTLPPWLQTADQARAFLTLQQANAVAQNRYFTSFSGYAGSSAEPAFTFVNGNCTLDGGAGLLIVTGNLEMNGNPNFQGLILVLGEGSVNRNGGGNGDIFGAIIVASFDRNGTGGFRGPTFTTNGGGTSNIQYDSEATRRALNLSGPLVSAVREY